MTSGCVGLDDERGLSLFAMAPGEPVGGEPPHGWPWSHEDAFPVLGVDEALALEDGEGVPDGHPGHSVVLDELSF